MFALDNKQLFIAIKRMLKTNLRILHLAVDQWLTSEDLRLINPLQYYAFHDEINSDKNTIQKATRAMKNACDLSNSKNWCVFANSHKSFLVDLYLNDYKFDKILIDDIESVKDSKINELLRLITDNLIETRILSTGQLRLHSRLIQNEQDNWR